MSKQSALRHEKLVARAKARERDLWDMGETTTLTNNDGRSTVANVVIQFHPRHPTQREKIWEEVWRALPLGITREHLAQRLGFRNTNSVNARVAELIAAGWAYDAGTGTDPNGCAYVRTGKTRYDARAITQTLHALAARKEQK